MCEFVLWDQGTVWESVAVWFTQEEMGGIRFCVIPAMAAGMKQTTVDGSLCLRATQACKRWVTGWPRTSWSRLLRGRVSKRKNAVTRKGARRQGRCTFLMYLAWAASHRLHKGAWGCTRCFGVPEAVSPYRSFVPDSVLWSRFLAMSM